MTSRPPDSADNPLVSVIIPAYNSAAYLAEALDSVLAQTYDRLEILVVDDGSTDNTPAILAKYSSPVRVLRQPNRGAAAARNHGIRESHGEIVAFLDADDIWYPQKLELQVSVFRSQPDVALVFTGHDLLETTGRGSSARGTDKRTRLMRGNLVRNIFMSSGVATPTVAVRRSALDVVGLFDEEFAMAEDDNLWMRLACRFRVELIDDALATIRLHKTSMTRDLSRLLASVQAHVGAMQDRYPDVWNEVSDLAPRKLSLFHFALGRQHLGQKELEPARAHFAAGLKLRPSSFGNRLYYWICLLPAGLLGPLWSLRRQLKGKPHHG